MESERRTGEGDAETEELIQCIILAIERRWYAVCSPKQPRLKLAVRPSGLYELLLICMAIGIVIVLCTASAGCDCAYETRAESAQKLP